MSISLITDAEKRILLDNHLFIESKKKKAALVGLLASLITAVALAVIAFSCLILTLPGIHVMKQVILPAVLPGSFALLFTIPLWVYCYKRNRAINQRLGTSLFEKDKPEKPFNDENNQQTIPILQNILKNRYSQLRNREKRINLLKNEFFPAPPDHIYNRPYRDMILKKVIEPLTEHYRADFTENLKQMYAEVLAGKRN